MPALLSPERPAQDPLAGDDRQRDQRLGAGDPVDDLSALRLVPVPDVGPPFDGEMLAGAAVCAMAQQWREEETSAVAAPSDPMTVGAGIGRSESAGEWPQQFARLVAEALAGARPVRQLLPWTSERARRHLRMLMPLFSGGQRPRVLRVIATRPTREVVEMTVIVIVGTRTRALAIRLEHMAPRRHLSRHADCAFDGVLAGPAAPAALRWVCTDIEAA